MRNRFIKSLAVVMVLSIAAIASTQSAYAGRGTRNFIFGAAAGVAGLTVLNSLSHRRHYYGGGGYYNAGYGYRRHNYYRRPHHRHHYRYRNRHRTYYAPRRSYRGRHAAWSPAWYRYCASKYRSFRASDGTFQPYNGGRRLCR